MFIKCCCHSVLLGGHPAIKEKVDVTSSISKIPSTCANSKLIQQSNSRLILPTAPVNHLCFAGCARQGAVNSLSAQNKFNQAGHRICLKMHKHSTTPSSGTASC